MGLDGPPDDELRGLSQRADAIEKKLDELVVVFTPSTWKRLKGGGAIALAGVSLGLSLANPLALVVSALSFLLAGDDATKWGGMEGMRLRLKWRRRDVENAAAFVRAEAVRRGL